MPVIFPIGVGPGWPSGWSLRIELEPDVLEVRGTADGRLEATARESSFVSQPLQVPHSGALMFVVQMGAASEPEILLDGVRLSTSDTPLRLTPHRPPKWPRSVDHSDARAACEPFMAARRLEHASLRIRPGRRRRSLAEELNKLDEAARVLEHAIAAVRAGDSAFAQSLQGQLRALVVTGPGPNWVPALQRVAAMLDEPLPVYALPNVAPPFRQILAPAAPGIDAWFSTEELMDLDDALERVARTTDGGAVTIREYVLELASSDGGGHIDAGTPIWADDPKRVHTNAMSADVSHLAAVGQTVITLGRHLVAVGRRSKRVVEDALARAYWTRLKLGALPSDPGWYDARCAIDTAQRDKDFAGAVDAARRACGASERWAELLTQLEDLLRLSEETAATARS